MQFSKSPNLKKYVKAFIDFEQYIKDINNIHSSTSKNHRGYLINQKIIEEIKNKINYKYNKIRFNEHDFFQTDDRPIRLPGFLVRDPLPADRSAFVTYLYKFLYKCSFGYFY